MRDDKHPATVIPAANGSQSRSAKTTPRTVPRSVVSMHGLSVSRGDGRADWLGAT